MAHTKEGTLGIFAQAKSQLIYGAGNRKVTSTRRKPRQRQHNRRGSVRIGVEEGAEVHCRTRVVQLVLLGLDQFGDRLEAWMIRSRLA